MAVTGGTIGSFPADKSGEAVRRDSVFRRTADTIRAREETIWKVAARIAVTLPLVALVLSVTELAYKAWPAVLVNGWHFLTGTAWNYGSSYGATVHSHGVAHPQGSDYGAWDIILGTIQSSVIALIFAVPVSIGAAFALTERLPSWLSRPLGFAIEILAGIPSVVIGLWGLLTLGPFLAKHIYPIVADHMPNLPVFDYFRNPVGTGEGLLTAGLVLGLMVVPIITSTTSDLFRQVPRLPKEGGEALGMTDWEVANKVTLPWVRGGIIGACVLALGRALGETIAVAMVGGSILHIAPKIYSPFTTIAATILTQLDGAQTDGTGFAVDTLAELAIVLAIISIAVNLIARVIITRSSRLGGPVGAG